MKPQPHTAVAQHRAATAASSESVSAPAPLQRLAGTAALMDHPLGAIVKESEQLVRALQGGVAANDSAALEVSAQQLQDHLFLVASQLLPLWREHCDDHPAVDRAEVRLAQLRHLVDLVLQHGPQDVMQTARCAVLAEELQRHQRHGQAVLLALDTVLAREAQGALAAIWRAETRRLQQSWIHGETPSLDNEDADPVGQPAQ